MGEYCRLGTASLCIIVGFLGGGWVEEMVVSVDIELINENVSSWALQQSRLSQSLPWISGASVSEVGHPSRVVPVMPCILSVLAFFFVRHTFFFFLMK